MSSERIFILKDELNINQMTFLELGTEFSTSRHMNIYYSTQLLREKCTSASDKTEEYCEGNDKLNFYLTPVFQLNVRNCHDTP